MNSISVVLPVYNREEFIVETLSSVENQSLLPEEVIVVDDNSSDNSVRIIDKYAKSSKLNINILQNRRQKGVSGARNWGILNSKSDFIAFLDSDDLWLPNHLQQLSVYLEIYHQASVAFSAVEFFGEAVDIKKHLSGSNAAVLRTLKESFEHQAESVWLSTTNLLNSVLTSGVPFRCPAVVIRRELFFDKNLFFDEDVNYTEDGLFFMMAANYSQFLYVDNVGVRVRRHKENDNINYGNKIPDSCEEMVIKLRDFFKKKNLDLRDKQALKQCLIWLQYDAMLIRSNTGNIVLCIKEALKFVYRLPGWVSLRVTIKFLVKTSLVRFGGFIKLLIGKDVCK